VSCSGTRFFGETNTNRAGFLKNIEVVGAIVAAANSSLLPLESLGRCLAAVFWVSLPLLDRCCCGAPHRQVHRSLSSSPQKEIIWIQTAKLPMGVNRFHRYRVLNVES